MNPISQAWVAEYCRKHKIAGIFLRFHSPSQLHTRCAMLGKQVRYYMQQKDELDFLHYVLNDPSIVLLDTWSHEPKPHFIPQPLDAAQTNKLRGFVLLWNTCLGDWEDCALEEVRIKKYVTESAAYVETGEIRYFIDRDNAPIIEFDRSFLNTQGQLTKGRIYANMYDRVGDDLLRKGIHFEKWFDQTARWLRSHFKRIEGVRFRKVAN